MTAVVKKQTSIPYTNVSNNQVPGGLGWKSDLAKTEKGGIVANLPNARRIISVHPYLQDRFGWSELDEDVMVMGPLPAYENMTPPDPYGNYPQVFTDKFDGYMRDLLSTLAEVNFNQKDVITAIKNVSLQNSYNAIEEYLKSLEWDGVPRLTEWLHQSLGAADTSLNSSIGFMFLVAACRRAVLRKYKFDSCLVLEGEKGIQKSTFLRVLFGDEYFVEGPGDIRKDETIKKLSGKWGAEFPEGQGLFTAPVEDQKAFITTIVDTYRRPYDRRAAMVPRRCVLVVTTNQDEYLKETGIDRRWWTVLCEESKPTNLQWLKDNRDQLWAEAYYYARDKTKKTYMEDSELESLGETQSSRVITDPWASLVQQWITSDSGAGVSELTTTQILNLILAVPTERQDRASSTKVGAIMRNLGWRKIRRGGVFREYCYVRPSGG